MLNILRVEKGVEGISASPDPNVMVFTNRFEDFEGFGRIRVTSAEPTKFAASVRYTALGLGSTNDYFDVNEGMSVAITSDGKYGFVAGRNGRLMGSGIPSIDGAEGAGGATAHGTVQVNQDGTVTYTPGDRFTGTDTFTYQVADNDGQQSEEATVTVNVANAAPKITAIQIPDTITEGDEVELEAIASDPGNDDLTYSWEFADDTTANGRTAVRPYEDNGTYTGKVTVTDTHGGTDTQDFEVVVENAAPVVDAGSDQTTDEGKAIARLASIAFLTDVTQKLLY